jgi:hypothetical protein
VRDHDRINARLNSVICESPAPVPDAAQRSSRCSAEPGPLSKLSAVTVVSYSHWAAYCFREQAFMGRSSKPNFFGCLPRALGAPSACATGFHVDAGRQLSSTDALLGLG